jgi:hypothetical protein
MGGVKNKSANPNIPRQKKLRKLALGDLIKDLY